MVKTLFLEKKKAKGKLYLLKLSPEGNASLLGILQHPDGTVLKQLQPPPRGPREQEFYNKVSVPQGGGGWLTPGEVRDVLPVEEHPYHCSWESTA